MCYPEVRGDAFDEKYTPVYYQAARRILRFIKAVLIISLILTILVFI